MPLNRLVGTEPIGTQEVPKPKNVERTIQLVCNGLGIDWAPQETGLIKITSVMMYIATDANINGRIMRWDFTKAELSKQGVGQTAAAWFLAHETIPLSSLGYASWIVGASDVAHFPGSVDVREIHALGNVIMRRGDALGFQIWNGRVGDVVNINIVYEVLE